METDLYRKTLKTMGVMVGACVAFTGVLTLIALLVVGRAVGPSGSTHDGPQTVPASKIDGPGRPSPPPPEVDRPPAKNADLPPRAQRAI